MVDVIEVESNVYLIVKLHEGQLFALDKVRQTQSFNWYSEGLRTKYRNKPSAVHAAMEGAYKMLSYRDVYAELTHVTDIAKREWWTPIYRQYPQIRGKYNGIAANRKAA